MDLYVAIGAVNPPAAERLYDRIEERSNQLALHPRMGSRWPDIRPSMRILVEPPYLILYETISDTDEGKLTELEIVRVVDGRSDLTVIL